MLSFMAILISQITRLLKTIVINPGTANGWFFGIRQPAAIFDTVSKECDFVEL